MTQSLKINRARENNLKEVSLDIPHDELVVVTGISGSGKSSLAFDTVYAEGQRRYIETFSPYTRQFLDRVKHPNVDSVENVRPAIAIQQRTRILSSRSTVGSMTNINDYLKLLWSNLAEPHCPGCGKKLTAWKAYDLAVELARTHEDFGLPMIYIAAPLNFSGKPFTGELERLRALGFSRIFDIKTNLLVSLEEAKEANLSRDKFLYVVLDRLKSDQAQKSDANLKRLRESIEQSFLHSGGICVAINAQSTPAILYRYSASPICTDCNIKLTKPRPGLFSYNHPLGACPECRGFGKVLEIDSSKVIPNPNLSIEEFAVQCWSGSGTRSEFRKLVKFCEAEKISVSKPWRDLSDKSRDAIFNHKSRDFRGVLHWFKRLEGKSYKMHVRVFLSKYRMQVDCPKCKGTRFKPDALAYKIDGKTIADLALLPISALFDWISVLLEERSRHTKLLRQLRDVFTATLSRLLFLKDLGLPYLTLDRQSRTLSGGETQRVNLATALGSELISTHFVLDEPSVGLHPRDTDRLIQAVKKLQGHGNSVLVVEHDPDFITAAGHIIEIGPGAGKTGGDVVFNGEACTWKGVRALEISRLPVESLKKRGELSIQNACARNLKGIDLKIPLHSFVCLTGVSGSGKSTLVHEVIEKGFEDYKLQLNPKRKENRVEGFDQIEQLLVVDQSPLAKSPRANIATYSGIWDLVRELLAQTNDAIGRALSKSAFSFNVEGGRCPHCEGAGFIKEDMQFLSDVYIQCELCLGKRFQEAVLEVQYKGKNAHDFLSMSVAEAKEFFKDSEKVARIASTLSMLGLEHLTLGHPLSELSGGEAQRLKLVPFVEQTASKSSLLVFDEPTTGLHSQDVIRLIHLLRTLCSRGHSVLCVEHNLGLIANADWIIDLGPEGGDLGGELMLCGTPDEFIDATDARSYTAQHLKRWATNTKAARIAKRKAPLSPSTDLLIEGARENNLKDIDVKIPLNKIVALTGVSGSGKSSIAKDIVYAEGQRRYLDCLSPYARQFIQELKRPDIDAIHNVKPAICVYQHTFQPSRFSTVGTMSEAYNYLRLLFSKLGAQYCPDHPLERITPLSSDEIADAIAVSQAKTVRLLAPIIKQKKGNHRAVLERGVQSDIQQVRIDGVFLSPGSVSMSGGLEKNKAHTIEFVIAKFSPTTAPKDLVAEAVTQGLSLGGGTLLMHTEKGETIFSTERTCPICRRGFYKPDPEDLSFHSKRGKCQSCEGAGVLESGKLCPECQGSRINSIGRNLRIAEKNIHELSLLTSPELHDFLADIDFNERSRAVSEPILRELFSRLDTLSRVGIDYIPLNRDCATLSGGELQRLRLATAMGSPLTGALYIFDEPSAGLHPVDNRKVLERLNDLKDRENSVIVIEHEFDSILSADHVIEIGPGGGRSGGEVVFSGPTQKLIAEGKTATADALRETPTFRDAPLTSLERMRIKNGNCNNIQSLDLELPLGCLLTFCGVSGAGKSSLLHGIVSRLITEGTRRGLSWGLDGMTLESSLPIERVLLVDQKPIGINSRSTPASYLGIFDEMRKVFANSLEAKSRGWSAGFFSYNTGEGKCPECKGLGVIKLEMNFLPDASMMCESCRGNRYSDEANSVLYQGMTISDALNFTFEEAKTRFANHRKILQPLRQACDLGLGYLKLGQSSTTLSGGESQRIKLVSELAASRRGHTLYVLDEPTTGLHKADVAKLMATLRELVTAGNSVYLIEHDPDVLLQSDYLVELGPGAGEKGGTVIFSGIPSELPNFKGWTPWKTEFSRILGSTQRSIA